MLVGLICIGTFVLFAIMACIPLISADPVIAQPEPTVIAQEDTTND